MIPIQHLLAWPLPRICQNFRLMPLTLGSNKLEQTKGLLYRGHHTELFILTLDLLVAFPIFLTVKLITLELNLLSDFSILCVPFVVVPNNSNLFVSYICPKQLLYL